jgi:F0F1-type ATP synthase membrane subunit b/b'
MTKNQVAEWCRTADRLENLLYLPKCTFVSYGTIETGFNSSCVGGIGELGSMQHTEDAMPAYLWFLTKLYAVSPAIAKECDAQITDHKDVLNPIKSLKVQAVLCWGAKALYADQLYWVSAVHWGTGRVDPWYRARIEPKEYFIFVSKDELARVDKRSPLMYYFHWKRVMSNFELFNSDVGRYVDDYNKYKEDCTKDEHQYIQVRELLAKMLRTSRALEEKKAEVDQAIADSKQIQAKLENFDDELGKIYGEAKKGKRSYDSVYEDCRKRVKQIIKELQK